MKKSLCLWLVTIMVMSLCSCSQPKNENGSNFQQKEPFTASLVTDVDGLMGDTRTSTENGYYQMAGRNDGSFNIIYTDFSQKEKMVLCARPECLHNNETCTGWVSSDDSSGGVGLFSNAQNLFILKLGNSGIDVENPSSSKIWKMNFSGDQRELVYEFSSAQSLWGAIASDESSFYFLLDTAAKSGENVTVKRELAKIDFATNTLTTLFTLDDSYYLVGTFSRGFVFKKITVNESSNDLTHTISTFDMSSQKLTPVKEWTGTGSMITQVSNHHLYCVDSSTQEVSAIDLNTLKTQIVTNSVPCATGDSLLRAGIFDHHFVFAVIPAKDPTMLTKKIFSVDLETGNISENSLSYSYFDLHYNVMIYAETKDSFLVVSSLKAENVTLEDPNGNPYTQAIDKEIYSLISKNDDWNNHPSYSEIADTLQ